MRSGSEANLLESPPPWALTQKQSAASDFCRRARLLRPPSVVHLGEDGHVLGVVHLALDEVLDGLAARGVGARDLLLVRVVRDRGRHLG